MAVIPQLPFFGGDASLRGVSTGALVGMGLLLVSSFSLYTTSISLGLLVISSDESGLQCIKPT